MEPRAPPWRASQAQRGSSRGGERTSPTPGFHYAACPALAPGAAMPETWGFLRRFGFTNRSAFALGSLIPILRTGIHFGWRLPLHAISR